MKKIAVVTGASSGMGRETAIQIADRFAGLDEIWLAARREDRLRELVKELPLTARIFPLDLTAEAGIRSLEEALAAEKPDVRILAEAAGTGTCGPVGGVPEADELAMIRLNCAALHRVTRAVLPHIGDGGRILLFASAAAFLPQPGFAIYAASKSFVVSYGRALGRELKGRGIPVTCVCPGPVDTEFLDHAGARDDMPAVKKFFIAKPSGVVRRAIRDMMMGKSVSVYGIPMNVFRGLCKVLPHDAVLDLYERLREGGREKDE